MMLLHKSTFNLYLECCVAAAQKRTVDVENTGEKTEGNREQTWICIEHKYFGINCF